GDGRPDRLLAAKAPIAAARRIVDERQQTALGPAALQPVMETAIELHELAEMHLALPPAAVRTPFARATPEPGGEHPAPQRFVINEHVILGRQVLGGQRRAEPLIHRAAILLADQAERPLPDVGRRRPIRWTTRAPVLQTLRAFDPIAPIHPFGLAIADIQQSGR